MSLKRGLAQLVLCYCMVGIPCFAGQTAYFNPNQACMSNLLSAYAVTSDEYRSQRATEFWYLFKNEPRFAAFVDDQINLGGSNGRNALLKRWKGLRPRQRRKYRQAKAREVNLTRHQEELDVELSYYNQDLESHKTLAASQYDLDMLTLKKGDTVRFGSKTFKLGKFLGAGNATHIYEIVGRPNEVLRIPYLAEGTAIARLADKNPISRIRIAREVAERYAELSTKVPIGQPHVRVIEEGRHHSFQVVTRVWGEETGLQYEKTLDALEASDHVRFFDDGIKIIKDMPAYERDKLKKFMESVNRLRGDEEVHWISPSDKVRDVRSLVWDVRRREWVLVDYE